MPKKDPQLGLRIKALREGLGESQAVFAERFGVEQPTIVRWEKGQVPKQSQWQALADLAGATVAKFFHSEDPTPASGAIPVGVLRDVLQATFVFLGEGGERARLLSDLVVEACEVHRGRGAGEGRADPRFLRGLLGSPVDDQSP